MVIDWIILNAEFVVGIVVGASLFGLVDILFLWNFRRNTIARSGIVIEHYRSLTVKTQAERDHWKYMYEELHKKQLIHQGFNKILQSTEQLILCNDGQLRKVEK